MTVAEYLNTGRENAITAQELAAVLECPARAVTIQIERERREGVPICAACGDNPGYYIAANEEELQTYCRQLQGRIDETTATLQALVDILRHYGETKRPPNSKAAG